MVWVEGVSFGLVVILLTLTGLWSGRAVQGEESYLRANRRLSFFALTATLVMVELNPATLVAFSAMGYVAGRWALTLPLIFLFGLGFYAIVVAKKWRAFKGHSVAQLFSQRYGKPLGRLASLALIVAMVGFGASYVKSATLLFSPILNSISPWAVSAFIVAAVLVMSWRGGLVSVVATDALSFLLIILFILACLVCASSQEMVSSSWELSSRTVLPLRFVVSLVVLTMFTYLLAPWYGQKIFAARSERTAFLAVGAAALLVFILYGAAIMAALSLRRQGAVLADDQDALPHLLRMGVPEGLRGIGYGLLFAASSTTLAGLWNAMSAMCVGDFLGSGSDKSAGRARLATLGFAVVSYLLANTLIDRVLDKLILANIPVAALSFALLAGFYWKRATPQGAWASIVVGIGWASGCYWAFGSQGLYTWYWAIYGIPLIFLSGIVVSLMTKPSAALLLLLVLPTTIWAGLLDPQSKCPPNCWDLCYRQCWHGGYEGLAEVQLVHPTTCDRAFAIHDVRLFDASNAFGSLTLPQGRAEIVEPDREFGFRFGVGALFNQRRNDLGASYTGLFTRDRRHVTVPDTQGLWATCGHPRFSRLRLNNASITGLTPLAGAVDAFANAKFGVDYNALEALVATRGKYCRLAVRSFLGLRWVKIGVEQTYDYQGTTALVDEGVVTFRAELHQIRTRGESWGLGPRLGSYLRYPLVCGLGVSTRLAASLLSGEHNAIVKQRTRSTVLQGPGQDRDEALEIRLAGGHHLIPELDARLSLSFFHMFGDTFYLELQAGWQWVAYLNAVDSVRFNHLGGTQNVICRSFRIEGFILSFLVGA